MKLVSLELHEWRSFERCELEFPDGIIGVRGVNGAGKTTIAEAIGWALFGKLPKGLKVADLRRQGAPKGARSSVTLTFRLGETLYTVERVVSGGAKLWIGDSDEPETTMTTATNERIVQELDLTWDTFRRTVYARQKDIAALDPTATGDARKKHVERLLGLGRYRLAAEKARARAKELEQQLAGLREQAPDLPALRAELEEARAEAASTDPEVARATEVHETAVKALTHAEAAVDVERGRCERHRGLVSEAASLERALEELDGDLADKHERLAERAAAESELASLNGRDLDVGGLERSRRAWELLRTCDEERDAASRGLDDDFDADAAKARASELESVRAELEQLHELPAADLGALRERVQALHAAAATLPVGHAEEALRRVDEARDDVRGRLATLRARITEDEEHLAAVELGGADVPCPTCLRPYGEDYERIVEQHRLRLADARSEVEALVAQGRTLDEERETAAGVLNDARKAADRVERTIGASTADEARAALAIAEDEASSRDARRDELRARREVLFPAVQEDERAARVTADARLRVEQARERFAAAAAAIPTNAFDAAALRAAVDAHEEAVKVSGLRATLTARLEATSALAAEVELLEGRRKDRRDKLEDVRTEIAELALDDARLGALKSECALAKGEVVEALQAVMDAKTAAGGRDQRVRDLVERVAEGETQHALLAEREREARLHVAAGDILSAYRTAQHKRAWPRLETGAGELLAATTEGRYADVRLSDDYKLVIVDRGEQHGLERYSGGEQDLANLCLRLAIADWVSRERNVELGFVILDEVFGSQDEERRQRLMAAVKSLGNRFHQLLVVTHVPDIAELCEHQLQVHLDEPGRSSAAFV